MELVTVFTTFNPAEAQLIRSRLEAANFQVSLAHELASFSMEGYSMATGGIRVEVPADQAEDAKILIGSESDSTE